MYQATATFTNCQIYDNEAYNVRRGPTHSRAPMEVVSRKCPLRSQGGGVYVYGTATFTDCEIHSNTATYVRPRPPPISMAPMEEVSRN